MFGRSKEIKKKAELISEKVMPAILDAVKNCKAKGIKFDTYEVEQSQRKKSKITPSWIFSVVYELESGFKYKEMLEAELLTSTRKFQSQNRIPDNVTDLTASVLGDKGIRISYEVLD